MTKYQYLIHAIDGQSLGDFNRQLHAEWLPAIEAAQPSALKLSFTQNRPPRLTILPLIDRGFALISVWHGEDPTPAVWRSGRTPTGQQVHAYRVEESIPRGYEKHWPDGQASPGVVMLTLLKRKAGVSDAKFMYEWHGRHTPKALRIHPLWSYIRNVVQAPLLPESPAFDGLVEEHFQTRTDLLNPVRMFGGPVKFLPHMLEVYRHVTQFLDLKGCENYLLEEVWIRSLEE